MLFFWETTLETLPLPRDISNSLRLHYGLPSFIGDELPLLVHDRRSLEEVRLRWSERWMDCGDWIW